MVKFSEKKSLLENFRANVLNLSWPLLVFIKNQTLVTQRQRVGLKRMAENKISNGCKVIVCRERGLIFCFTKACRGINLVLPRSGRG